MSAKDSFKARRKTGDSRPASEVSKTLRQGDTQWAFSTKLQQHSQSDSQPSWNAGSGKDCQEAAQQAGSEGNSQAENVRVGGSTVIVQPRKLLNERQRNAGLELARFRTVSRRNSVCESGVSGVHIYTGDPQAEPQKVDL